MSEAQAQAHDCEASAPPGFLLSGYRQDGETWTCFCGRTFVHSCDEAEGCTWLPVDAAAPQTENRT